MLYPEFDYFFYQIAAYSLDKLVVQQEISCSLIPSLHSKLPNDTKVPKYDADRGWVNLTNAGLVHLQDNRRGNNPESEREAIRYQKLMYKRMKNVLDILKQFKVCHTVLCILSLSNCITTKWKEVL